MSRDRLRNLTSQIRDERSKLLGAMRFNNTPEIQKRLLNLTVLNSRVSDEVMDILEKESKANSDSTIGSPVNPPIQGTEHATMNVNRDDRFWTK